MSRPDAQWAIPQQVKLQDGSWVQAPWVEWSAQDGHWKCHICAQTPRITPEHLAGKMHVNRTNLVDGYLGYYTRELGSKIVGVWTHELFKRQAEQADDDAPADHQQALEDQPGAVRVPPGLQHQVEARLEVIERKLETIEAKLDTIEGKLDRLG